MRFVKEEKELRLFYSDLLLEYAAQDERIVVVDADLMGASSHVRFRSAYPERTIDAGVAEANMIGTAAGLSAMGKIPFTHSFTTFASRRCMDQVMLSVAYAGLNVKMVGSDPGVTAELNGGTHMGFEDIAVMRVIPEMTIVEPADGAQLTQLFPQILEHYGPVYIRLARPAAVRVTPNGFSYTLGKAAVLKAGSDISIFSSGIMTAEALEAADLLAEEGICAEVINIHTIKPLDAEAILRSTAKTGCAVTAENANIIGGLGGAVAETLAEGGPVPVVRVGVRDRFGEVGYLEYLKKALGLTADDIVAAAKKALGMKG